MQDTRYHDADWHSDDTTRVVYKLQVGERKSKAASNYTELNLRSLLCSV
jgi:hypothetical protein